MRALAAMIVVLGAGTAAARADRIVGVAIIGDPVMATPLTASVGDWLSHRGMRAAPVTPDALGTVTDCFALADDSCARAAFAKSGTADAVVVVVHGEPNAIVLDAHWLAKDRATITQSASCGACGDADRATRIDTLMSTLASAAGAVSQPPVAVTARSTPAGSRGLALGVELGEPTSATAGLFSNKLALTGALGTGTFAGKGPSLHAEARYAVARVSEAWVRVGGGLRYYHHGYAPASIDEVPDSHYGIRAIAEIAFDRGPLEFYAEIAPGIDFKRTSSCTLADGVRSICPHAQATPLFLDVAIGARWFVFH